MMGESCWWRRIAGIIGVAALTSGLVSAGEDQAVTVRGRVADADGKGLTVMLLVISDDERLVARSTTNADGTFELALPDVPVQIVPHVRAGGRWEFEPIAERVSGAYEVLEFTGYKNRIRPVRGQVIDAESGEPLAGALVTLRRSCPEQSADPAARYRQSGISLVRADDQGLFGIRCLPSCDTTLQFGGDSMHGGASLGVAADDCPALHVLEIERR